MTSYPQTRQDDTEISAWNAAANMHGNTGNVPFAAARIAAWRSWEDMGYQFAGYPAREALRTEQQIWNGVS